MDGLATISEELFHRRVGPERRDEFYPAFPDRNHRNLDAFALEPFAPSGAQSQPALVGPNRLIEITDGDPDVVDPAQHG